MALVAALRQTIHDRDRMALAPPWVNEAVTKITLAMARSRSVFGIADSREPASTHTEHDAIET